MANSAVNSREGNMQITDTPSIPLEIMHVDHFGPLKESSNGLRHILIIIDAFSRFTWLFPVKSTTSKEVIKHLSILFQNFTNPLKLISDRRTAFTSQEFANFLKNHKITHHQVAVAAPWANGLVERVNRFVKSSLKKIVEDQAEWDKYLSLVQYAVNNTYHSSLKASPSKVFFGFDQRNHSDSDLVKFLNNIAKVEFDLEKVRDTSRDLAVESTVMPRGASA